MHVFVLFCIGVVCALALKRKNAADPLGGWRLLCGGVAAAFPHVDKIPSLLGVSSFLRYEYTWTWSLVLVPFMALCVSWLFAAVSKHSFMSYFPIALGSVLVSLGLSLITENGINPFYPFTNFRVALKVLFPFDLILLCISWVAIALCFLLNKWRRDVARVAVVLMLAYIGAVVTFRHKAENYAQQYAATMGLQVTQLYVLPQPISPFNWRLIVVTERNRLHDTMVNLFKTEEEALAEDARRSARIHQQYKPLSKAVWRIYRRFGRQNEKAVQQVWQEQENNHTFMWAARFAVFEDLVEYNNQACTRFKDLRYLNARRDQEGNILLCSGEKGNTVAYRSNEAGLYGRLN